MKKSTIDLLIPMYLIGNSEYNDFYIDDNKVSECLTDMFFYMMYVSIGNEEKKEEYFNEFEKKYDNLDDEQQEKVKREYINIIEAQNKNREKERVKKKGMNNYE